MTFRRWLGFGSLLGLLAASAAISIACGSSDDTSSAGASPGAPPSKPSAPATTSTDEHNYAVRKLYFGDMERSGAASKDAWRTLGYDLDGKDTKSAKDTDVCKNAEGNVVDGENGIDNAFGARILPLLLTAKSDIASATNDVIEKGGATAMIDVKGLDDKGIPQTATGLSAQLFAAGKFSENGAPTWTTADDWPVRPELLAGGTLAGGSQVKFGDAWIKEGQFASGAPTTIVVSMTLFGANLSLTMHKAVVTFDHKAPGKVVNGTIAGVIKTQELIDEIGPIAGRVNTSLCQGTELFDNVVKTLKSASDMLVEGEVDPSKDCDGISIGLGFDADEIGLPKTVADEAAPTTDPDPCVADAGTD